MHALWRPALNPTLPRTSCCILLHGFTNDAHVWDHLARELQATHNVLAPDFRGHGDSDWDTRHRYSHWQLADDVEDLVEALVEEMSCDDDVQPEIHIVGHSLGARVAMLALEQISRPIASLTVIDAGPEVNSGAGERLVNDVQQLPAFYESQQAYHDSLARIYMMADSDMLANIARFGLRMRKGRLTTKTDPAFTPGVWHKNPEFRDLHKERGELSVQLWKAWRSLNLPVHLVRGQASSILDPALASRMVEALGHRVVFSVVPRAGHAVMVDNPLKSTALISQFIARSKPGNNAGGDTWQAEKALESAV